jgi:hypothetical protein
MLADAYLEFYQIFERSLGDRSGTVGASEIGQCARQTFWRKNYGKAKGVEQDDDYESDWGARIRGVIMEFVYWVPALRKKYGADLLFAGTEQEKLISGHLSATPDGLLINRPYDALREFGIKNINSDCITMECKTIDPRTNLVTAKETNIYQVNTQIGLFRETTKYQPEYGLLTYTDASFWSEVDEFPIQFDPMMYQAAHERATDIITAKDGRDLMPEGWVTGGKECSFCPFTKACGVERRGVPYGQRKASPQFVAEISDRAKEHNVIKIDIERKEAELKTIQLQIKTRLKEKGIRRIPNVVNWYEVAAPVRYQNKEIRQAFAELGGDSDDYMTIGEPSDRLVVSATPDTKRVVRPIKTPNRGKRASNTKQTANREHAHVTKKTSSRKRVIKRKKTDKGKRATKREKTSARKRAKIM